MKTGFSEQIEAKATDRQAHFADALLTGKPLRPERGQWTLGDTIYLRGLLGAWMKNLRPYGEDEFSTPLQDIFGDAE